MKVYILTEGGSKFGYGHVVRCSSLYEELFRRGFNVEFIINGDIAVKEALRDKKYSIRDWLSINFLSSLLTENDYVIVDSYLAGEDINAFISKHTKKSVFIDDNVRLNYPNGVVVNPSIYASELKYPKNAGIRYLLGKDYVLLRDTFLESERESTRPEVKEFLVTLGGADIRNLTPKILTILKNEYPNVIKNVIIGKGFRNIEKIKEINDLNINYFYNVNAIEMKELMIKSDIAITAAGQTIYELIKTGTPFIPIQIIENQENNVKGLLEYNLVNEILYSETTLEIDINLINEMKYMMVDENRVKITKKMQGIVDGKGSIRIIDELLS